MVQWTIDAFVIRNCQKQWQSICKVNNFSIVIQGQKCHAILQLIIYSLKIENEINWVAENLINSSIIWKMKYKSTNKLINWVYGGLQYIQTY